MATATASPAASGTRRAGVPDWLLPWLSVLAVLALFELLPRIGVLPRDHFPPISETLAELARQLTEAGFWEAVFNTMQGWALGLAIAAALPIPLGLVIG